MIPALGLGPAAKWAGGGAIGLSVAVIVGIETEVWVALITAAVSAYGIYLGYRQATNKTRLDWHQLELARLREQASADDDRIASLEKQLRDVRVLLLEHELGVRQLIDQLQRLDVEPVWQPKTEAA